MEPITHGFKGQAAPFYESYPCYLMTNWIEAFRQAIPAQKKVLGVGLMSGTSVDAIDVALVQFGPSSRQKIQLVCYSEYPYPDSLQRRIRRVMSPETSGVDEICQLNVEIGELLAQAVLQFISEHSYALEDIEFIASHGQTIYHIPTVRPDKTWHQPSTLQIGEPCVIAQRTGITTVADFRLRDMAAGGVGAPLIPFADAVLFGHNGHDVICQNIGGIANCTLIKTDGSVIAFDSGPGNMVMDLLMQKHTDHSFDQDGALAASGTVLPDLITEAIQHPYFTKSLPKATGHEDFGREFVNWFESRSPQAPLADLLATALELTVQSIVQSYKHFLEPVSQARQVIVSGGGAKNPVLMQRFKQCAPYLDWKIIDEWGIPSEAKEALGFAILGYATIQGIPSTIPSVTGAKEAVVLGKVVPGKIGLRFPCRFEDNPESSR